jgi:CBS domain-containing protein
MTPHAVSASPSTTISQAATLLRGRSIGCLPIIDKGKLVGIVTVSDLLELLSKSDDGPSSKRKRKQRRNQTGPRQS